MRSRLILRVRGFLGCLAVGAALCAPASASAADGDINTVAGNGTGGFSGDGGPATAASLQSPDGISATADGGYLIADYANNRIRKVAANGIITTVAGNGTAGYSGDGGAATSAQLDAPIDVAVTADGGFLIAEVNNHTIRKVSAGGIISTVVGNGANGPGGDGGAAVLAQLNRPNSVYPTPSGGFLISDTFNHRVREVSGGIINTVAGTGTAGGSGDGGAATAAQLNRPFDAIPTPSGGILITDALNQRVREVSAGGVINTVAGTGTSGFSGDGGPATAAQLFLPDSVSLLADGSMVFTDSLNNRVRRVSTGGIITTVAGTTNGFSGDGGPATAAQLSLPNGLLPRADGSVLVVDSGSDRVRRIEGLNSVPGSGPTPSPTPVLGKRVVVRALRGAVTTKCRGDRRFTRLRGTAAIPVGCIVNTNRGALRLTSVKNRAGQTQSAKFYNGTFRVTQTRSRRPETILKLVGPRCGHHRRAARRGLSGDSSSRPRRRKRKRHNGLWGSGKGKFTTKGHSGSASVRGTIWYVEDRCDGSTLFRVRRGVVTVRDFRKKRRLNLRAGRTYLAG